MLKLLFEGQRDSAHRVLCLGAHSDDIEIGCGGTLLRLIQEYSGVSVSWIVFGSSGERSQEAINSAQSFLKPVQDKKIIIKEFRDGFFPYIGAQIKDFFEQLKDEVSPDIIFTHYRQDLHQDHRLISELTWNTFRYHLILEYEIPKYDGDLGTPNLFVQLEREFADRKVNHILDHFSTQRQRHWFTAETFYSIMRLRAIESGSRFDYAEAFYFRKLVL
jgi:LmbE family N-acetylglucosaminyl deacetylase